MCSGDIFLGVLAIFFPPIAVWIKSGICTADSLINILLCTLGYLPGLLHAWYIISLYPEPDYDYETIPHDQGENGRVTCYYISQGPNEQQLRQQGTPQGQQQPRGYGTTDSMRVPQPQQQSQGEQGPAEGGVPPSYEQAVRGDHKVQT
ncbi:hypothetical protein P7C71_g1387, partial [Lecanoromycetidae sp. Uapishka_2]